MVSEMTFKEFGEFSHNQLKVMSDKSLLYYVLAEECIFWTNAAHRISTFWTFHYLSEVFPIPRVIFETRNQFL